MASYGLINVSYFVVQESFKWVLLVAAILYASCFVTNAVLDQVAKSAVSAEEVGVLMGSLSQARSLAVVIFVVPGGFLFKFAEESAKQNGVWQWGLPWMVFSVFGFVGAAVAATAKEIKYDIADPGGAEDDGELYTKLNDADNDVEDAWDADEVVRRSSSALLEMGAATTGMVLTVPTAFPPDVDDVRETLP